jgi:two-component system cell cycle sensor histidine kinase/response regulator CckA
MALVVAVTTAATSAAQGLFGSQPTRAFVAAVILSGGTSLCVALLWLSAGRSRARAVLPIVVFLNASAIACAAVLPMGLDMALIMPFLAAALLVAVVEGPQMRVALAVAWLCGVVAVAVARAKPEMQAIPHAESLWLGVTLNAVTLALCYGALGWAVNHWRVAMARAARIAEMERVAELAQRRSDERLRALAEASPLPTLAFNVDCVIHFWNPAAERLLGWTAHEATGRSFLEFVPGAVRGEMAARIEQALSSGKAMGPRRSRLLHKDGQETLVEVHGAIERDEAGHPAGMIVQFLDVTQREAMEARLMEGQRLEAIGQLAGGVAHDFNNSLTAIAGFASLIASGQSPDTKEDARTILSAAEHAATLTRQLLAFSRRVPLQPQLIDLRQFVLGVEPLVQRLIGERIAVRVETDRRSALTEVDPPSLEQAVLNLVANARDAMPLGGELTLAVRACPACLAEGASEPKDHVAVVVSDTGTGMAPLAMRHLFEPFFTTKPPGKGTGMGLPMVHGFVAQSGGHVVVTSPPGQGTTIEMHFERVRGGLSKAPRPARPVGGHESILFVEDDPAVASFGLACLRRLGYDVTPALNGSEAVALAASRGEPFDLLLTDVVIPGMSGPELAALLHARHPATAILYASGYTSDSRDGPDAPLLVKPYSRDELASKVREALDQPGARARTRGRPAARD